MQLRTFAGRQALHDWSSIEGGLLMKRKLGKVLAKKAVSVGLALVMIFTGSAFVSDTFAGDGGRTGVIEVQAATVKLNYSTCKIDKGQQLNLYVKGTGASVRWSSSNKSVAVVDAYGCVTGKSKGTAYVTAKLSNGKKYRCKVLVSGRKHIRRSGNVISDGRRIYLREGYDSSWNVKDTLYVYNPQTNKKARLSTLKCKSIDDIKGKYVYVTARPDSSSYTDCIYRVAKNGSSKKCLAKGSNAKIIGNYIYYRYSNYGDSRIYRMKLDGTGKTYICSGNYELCVANNKLVGLKQGIGGRGYTQDVYLLASGGRTKKISFSASGSANRWVAAYDSCERFTNVGSNPYGYSYTNNGFGSALIRKASGSTSTVKSFRFNIYEIYDAGEYVVVTGCSESVVKTAIVSKNGSSVRTLSSRPATHQYIPGM